MVWEYEKFRGDAAIYAFCPKCKFHHNPSRLVDEDDGHMTTKIMYQYNYCPICGEYLFDESADKNGFEITWNERNIEDLWAMEG